MGRPNRRTQRQQMTYQLYLGSGSPRRMELLQQMNIPFVKRVLDIDEVYPKGLSGANIADYLAKLKGKAHQSNLEENELVLTADTIVWHENEALGKPKDKAEAHHMLSSLAGKTHQVISAVCLSSAQKQWHVNDCTHVRMKSLTEQEINYYIDNYNPLDKAGAYGIQEWIGLIGVTKIEGSYTNVVGLPTEKTYTLLQPFGLSNLNGVF